MMTLPEDVGYPILENGQAEYFMVETHYDNPEQLAGVSVLGVLDIYSTDTLR